jgi:hypothetical protein
MIAIAKRLESIKDKGGLLLVDVANVLGTRPETVSRWNQDRAFPHPATERLLLELEWIVDQLSDFYEPKEARMWLFSRQKLFDGKTPAELISEGKTEEVLAAIRQLRDSVFV